MLRVDVTSKGEGKERLIEEFHKEDRLDAYAESILRQHEFTITHDVTYHLGIIEGRDFDGSGKYLDISEKARKRGWSSPPMETILLLLKQLPNEKKVCSELAYRRIWELFFWIDNPFRHPLYYPVGDDQVLFLDSGCGSDKWKIRTYPVQCPIGQKKFISTDGFVFLIPEAPEAKGWKQKLLRFLRLG